MNYLLNFWKGTVTIQVIGKNIERFLNILSKRDIIARDIRIYNEFCILKLYIKDFSLIRAIVRKTKVKIRIQRKAGFPFLFLNLKKRKMFILGFGILVFVLYFLSLFIWKIEIVSNDEVDRAKIIDRLRLEGVERGVLKSSVDNDYLVETIIKEFDDVSWAFAKFDGYSLVISVSMRKKTPDVIDTKRPSSIVAKKDGIIKKVVAKSGFAKVKEGDTVRKGDTLITGEIVFKDGRKKEVHSFGEVYARTWYSKRVRIETISFERIRTGNVVNRYYCNLASHKMYFYNTNAYDENYDKIDIELSNGIFNKIGLPFELWKTEIYENKMIERSVDYESALMIAKEKAREGLGFEIPKEAEIVQEDENVTSEGEDTFLELIIECMEDIGETNLIER
jgi:similar to stage IV sporulation protein